MSPTGREAGSLSKSPRLSTGLRGGRRGRGRGLQEEGHTEAERWLLASMFQRWRQERSTFVSAAAAASTAAAASAAAAATAASVASASAASAVSVAATASAVSASVASAAAVSASVASSDSADSATFRDTAFDAADSPFNTEGSPSGGVFEESASASVGRCRLALSIPR